MIDPLRRRLGRLVIAVIAGLGLAGALAAPAFADPPGPTDYQSEVRSVEPETPTIEVGIIGGDSFFEMRVDPGVEAIVVGYQAEDYLWFRPDGVVLENQNSPATYLNANRYGNDGVPSNASADAEPDWKQVATGGYWTWHDHRAHWMQSARPFGLEAGDQILEAVIPIVVDGETVEVTVISTWQPEPSPLAMWLGAVAGAAAAVGAWFLRDRRVPPIAATIPLVVLALGVGAAQYTSLPSETGPRPIWIVLPIIAAVSAAVGVVLGNAWQALRCRRGDAARRSRTRRVGIPQARRTHGGDHSHRCAVLARPVRDGSGPRRGRVPRGDRPLVALRRAEFVCCAGRCVGLAQRFHGAVGLTAPGPPVSTS